MTPFKRKRLAAGLTTTQLGAIVGASHVTVQRWERGENIPDPKYFPKLADAFGISAEDVTYLFAPADTKSTAAA